MAFNASATPASGNETTTKQYFWLGHDYGNGLRKFCYVTADALATVDGSNYITDQNVIDILNVGDLIQVYVVDSVDDTRTIVSDMAAGVADIGLLMVMENTGTVVDLSSTDIWDASGLTYGD